MNITSTRTRALLPAILIAAWTLTPILLGCAHPRSHIAASAANQYTLCLTPILNGDIGTNGNPSYAVSHSVADCTECSTSSIMTAETSVGPDPSTGIVLYSVIRTLLDFDTSAIGADATITSATLSVAPSATHMDYATHDFIRLVTNSIESTTAYSTADFNCFGTAAQATDIQVEGLATNTVAVFTLNAEGLASISKTGVTKFGIRTGADVEDTTPVAGTDASFPTTGGTVVFMYSARNAAPLGPMLTITYTLSTPPPTPSPTPTLTPTPAFGVTIDSSATSGTAPLTVSFSYQSSNGTPASQVWDVNGAQFSTAPSFSVTFASAGTYSLTLNVTDSSGAVAQSTAVIGVSPPANSGNN